MIWTIDDKGNSKDVDLIGKVEWELPKDIAELFESYPPQVFEAVRNQFIQVFQHFLNSLTLIMTAPDFTWVVTLPELQKALLNSQKEMYAVLGKIYDQKKEYYTQCITEVDKALERFAVTRIKIIIAQESPLIGKDFTAISKEFDIKVEEGTKFNGQKLRVGDELIFSGSPENLLYLLKKHLKTSKLN